MTRKEYHAIRDWCRWHPSARVEANPYLAPGALTLVSPSEIDGEHVREARGLSPRQEAGLRRALRRSR